MKRSIQHSPSFTISRPLLLSWVGVGASSAFSAQAQMVFSEPVDIPGISDVEQALPINLNDDSLPDVVTLHAFGDLSFYINEGNGEFSFAQALWLGHEEGISLQVGDIDDNGMDDVIWLSVYQHQVSGQRGIFVIHDVQRGNIQDRWRWIFEPASRSPKNLRLGDLDDDGDLDLVITALSDPGFCVYKNDGSGAFALADSQSLPRCVRNENTRIGDVDLDGDSDVVILNVDQYTNYYDYVKHNDVFVLLNNGSGQFAPAIRHEIPIGENRDHLLRGMTMDDFDNDGYPELALVGEIVDPDGPTYLGYMENRGVGQFELKSGVRWYRRAWGRYQLESADLDADGDIDLLLSGEFKYYLNTFENTGNFKQFVQSEYALNSREHSITLSDLNDDGSWDILVGTDHGFTAFFNESALPGPMLDVSELQRGESAVFNVTDATPDKPVFLLGTLNGIGSTRGWSILNGMTLDLNLPIQLLESSVADADGNAQLDLTVPHYAPFGTYAFQVISPTPQGDGEFMKSNFAQRRIVD